MAIFEFGSGVLLGTRTDIANATPTNFGLVQEVTLDLSFTTKELYGQNQFPVAIGRGTAKMTGKAKMAQISGLAFNNLFFGGTMTAGITTMAYGEAQTVPAATVLTTSADTPSGSVLPFASTTGVRGGQGVTGSSIPAGTTVTAVTSTSVTLSNAIAADMASGSSITFGPSVVPNQVANFVGDWGVVYAATGLPLTFVPYGTAPAQGEYTFKPEVYVYDFSVADAGALVLLNYSYNNTSVGRKLTLTNQALGTTPTFSARLYTTFGGKTVDVYIYNCVSSKLAYATKLEDFTVPELDFSVFANSAGNVLDWSFSEAS
jgi:hypothetical protein